MTIPSEHPDPSGKAALRAGEARVLSMVAAGEPLPGILDTLVRAFQAEAEGMVASILLVEDGVRLRIGAAPSLPEEWVRLMDGGPIGMARGSCAAAVYLRQTVAATDIATDPHWADYRDAALSHGLRACWSVPILGPQGVLGAFALYYGEPREPTPRLLALAAHGSHLANVVIQHHRLRDAARESEVLARLIVENALDANVLMDDNGVVTSWNARATAIFGWTAEEAVGKRLAELVIPERFRGPHERGFKRYLETGESSILGRRIEVSALHRDGHEFPAQLAITAIHRSDRVLFSAFLQDLSASKEAEDALRDSEQHLSLVYDQVDDELFQIKVEPGGFRFVSVNPAFTAATGLAAAQVVGRYVHQVIPEPSRSVMLGKYGEALETRKTVRWEETTSYPTGTRIGDVAVTPVYDGQGLPRFLIGSVRDVTEHRRMQDEVRQLQKLEAIGRLSAGIAHDFNNILTVIIGIGNMLIRDLGDSDQRSQVEEIVRAGERGAALTRQFLAFSRKQVLQPEVLNLDAIVRGLEPMLRRLLPADITLKTSHPPARSRVRADPGQIEQVVLNLVVNARDAMPSGGVLTIETADMELDAAFAHAHPGVSSGPHVMMTVSDTGHGMDEATLKQVFEPLFTTKPPGKGTGLGLASVYGIVRQSGGAVYVDSRPGQGSAFRIYLPRCPEEALSAPAPRIRDVATQERGLEDLHVLVVEDEPALQRSIARMLQRLRCKVTVASNGDIAIDEIVARGVEPDLLLTDMMMPGMSGTALAERLRMVRPHLKVLSMSGYAGDEGDSTSVLEAATPFLQKPFTLNELARGLHRALEAKPRSA